MPSLSPSPPGRVHVGLLTLVVLVAFQGARVVAAVSGPGPQNGGVSAETAEQVWDFLDRAEEGGAIREEVVADIVRLGPRTIPMLYGILSGEVVKEDDGRPRWEGSGGPSPDGMADRDWILVESLSELPSDRVLAHVRTVATGDASVDQRLLACHVLRDIDDPGTLDLLIEITSEIDPIHYTRPYVQRTLTATLGRVLERQPQLFRKLDSKIEGVDRGFLPVLVQSLPTTRPNLSVDFALSLFGNGATLDRELMRRISELAQGPAGLGDIWSEQEALSTVRRYLYHDDWEMRREAVVALGYLQDFQSFSELIDRLDDPHRAVVRSVHWSLARMSGRKFDTPELWQSFYEAELAWFAAEATDLERDLSSRNEAEVFAAIRELSRRPLFKHELAIKLTPMLDHSSLSIVNATCSALVQLGSYRAVPALTRGLDRGGNHRKVMWKALKSITGRTLPPERALWEAELGV